MLTPAEYVTTPGSHGQDVGVWDTARIETFLRIKFQSGPISAYGVNGVADADVIKLVADHVRAQQRVEPSRSRAMVITKLDEALLWEQRRVEEDNTRAKAVERAGERGGE